MDNLHVKEKKASGIYSEKFYNMFRALFRPVTRTLLWTGVTPNIVTILSLVFGAIAGILFAIDHLWLGMISGYLMAFSDIVDGQLAKEYGKTSRFGEILDSTIDRYNEFFIYAGLGIRYFFHGYSMWTFLCAVVFLNSVMISYVKARAEAAGFDCNIGIFQRPERLTLVAIAVAFDGLLLNPAMILLAVGTQITVLQRIFYVYKQSS